LEEVYIASGVGQDMGTFEKVKKNRKILKLVLTRWEVLYDETFELIGKVNTIFLKKI